MDENREEEKQHQEDELGAPEAGGTGPSQGVHWPKTVMVALLLAVLFSLVYAFRQRDRAQQLTASQEQMASALDQTRSRLDALAQKVGSLAAAPAAATAPSTPRQLKPAATEAAKSHKAQRARALEDARWKKMQQQIDDQQQQLQQTRQDVDAARSEMSDNLNSTRDDLNGSIARTHDELVALEQKGERDYHEFDLNKSKRYQRVGPIEVSLRKTNVKHRFYDVMLLVDDDQLAKKHVDLYEPIWIYPSDSRQPIQLVVNKISKDGVHGYVSEPKSNGAESPAPTTGASTGTEQTPASTTGSAAPNPANANQSPDLAHRPSAEAEPRF